VAFLYLKLIYSIYITYEGGVNAKTKRQRFNSPNTILILIIIEYETEKQDYNLACVLGNACAGFFVRWIKGKDLIGPCELIKAVVKRFVFESITL
jgi:hypothetical protein